MNHMLCCDVIRCYFFRIRFGSNNLFVFIDPAHAVAKKGNKLSDITYEFALSEITRHAGLDIADGTNISHNRISHKVIVVCGLMYNELRYDVCL